VRPVTNSLEQIAHLQVLCSSDNGARIGPRAVPCAPEQTTQPAHLQALQKREGTGLEPATSGVTGRVGYNDAARRAPLNDVISRHFSSLGRLRFAWLSQSSDRRLGHEWATKPCLQRQRAAPGATTSPGTPCTTRGRLDPPYHGATAATGCNPGQRLSPIWAEFAAIPFATGCQRLRPLGSINAPSWCAEPSSDRE
jgi:hypothetical protein